MDGSGWARRAQDTGKRACTMDKIVDCRADVITQIG
jgi:hypothetical protein